MSTETDANERTDQVYTRLREDFTERLEVNIRESLLRGIKDLRESLEEMENRARNEKNPLVAIRRALFNLTSGHTAAMVAIQTALSYAEGMEAARAHTSPVPMEPKA